jgi:hypothetical protein
MDSDLLLFIIGSIIITIIIVGGIVLFGYWILKALCRGCI